MKKLKIIEPQEIFGFKMYDSGNLENLLQQQAELSYKQGVEDEYKRCIELLNHNHANCTVPLICIGYQDARSDLINNEPKQQMNKECPYCNKDLWSPSEQAENSATFKWHSAGHPETTKSSLGSKVHGEEAPRKCELCYKNLWSDTQRAHTECIMNKLLDFLKQQL